MVSRPLWSIHFQMTVALVPLFSITDETFIGHFYGTTRSVPYKKQELLNLREHLWSSPFFMGEGYVLLIILVFCVMFVCFVCLCLVSCVVKCYHCLWIVYSWLSPLFSPMMRYLCCLFLIVPAGFFNVACVPFANTWVHPWWVFLGEGGGGGGGMCMHMLAYLR